MTTFLKTYWGRYVSAEINSDKVIANREEVQPWEEFSPEVQNDGRVAFRTAHGTYLSAHPDGRLIHKHPFDVPGESPGDYELFKDVRAGDVVALQTYFGTYLCAEDPDNQELEPYTIRHRHPNDKEGDPPGPWEALTVQPWWNGTVVPGEHIDPVVGVPRLIYSGSYGMGDDSGHRLFWGVHAGDLCSRMHNGDPNFVEEQVVYFAANGAHIVRTWPFLWGNWWATAPRPGEFYPDMAGWEDTTRRYSGVLLKNKVMWLVSNGDLFRAGWSMHRMQDYMGRLATILKEEGGLELVFGVDAGNENASAGNPDAETMARVLDPFLSILRPAIISTTSNDENDLNRYVSRVCTVCDSHAGRWPFKMAIERCWTAGYWDGKMRPYLASSEPFGVGCQEFHGDMRVGHHISATAVPADWDDLESMGVAAAAHFLSRQLYIYMSSPGVISDEPFSNYPALELTGWLARRLPRDIQSWKIFHGGENRSFSPDRILAVPGDDRARCEHSRNDNQYVVLVHGEPGTHRLRAINGFSGVQINLETKEETPVSWRAGETISVAIRRGCLFIGDRQ